MPNRFSAGCECCQSEGGCSQCVDRYLTSITVEIGAEVISIPVNKKIAEIPGCEIYHEICTDETEVTVLDYQIDSAWDGRTGCYGCQCNETGGGGPGPTPTVGNCKICSTGECGDPPKDYYIRTFSIDNLTYSIKVKYQIRYAISIRFTQSGLIEAYVSVQLYLTSCVRYEYDVNYYVNTNCPRTSEECGQIEEPGTCTNYFKCGDQTNWILECTLHRCSASGNDQPLISFPGEQASNCCTHSACAPIPQGSYDIESCAGDPEESYERWSYYRRDLMAIGGIAQEVASAPFCDNGDFYSDLSVNCSCDTGNDGWWAQAEFASVSVAFTFSSGDCVCPGEFGLGMISNCIPSQSDNCNAFGARWPVLNYAFDPCVSAKCFFDDAPICLPGAGDATFGDCCMDTDPNPAPVTIDLAALHPGEIVYITLNCT